MNDDNKIRFLVTGGAGFIGSNLCEYLIEHGHHVRCLDNLSTGNLENISHLLDNKSFEWIEGTITDYDTCLTATRDVDYVLHQAALGSVPRSMAFPLLYEEANIKGTSNMLEASLAQGVKKFVYASSSSVYGDSKQLPKKEGEEGRILSPYALTKKVNEEYASLYSEVYGLPTIGLRYFNVYGKRQNPDGQYAAVIPKFIQCLLRNEPPIINGDGTQSRDFTYIKNVVDANIKAAFSSSVTNGKAYNIACGDQFSLNELLKNLKELLDKQDIEPDFALERAGDIKHSNADISKAQHDFGYDVSYTLFDGLKETVQWYTNK
ncbi:epimerase [Enterococcus florum]|uniref:Epimerase n=1 Tax=Enterococcus florum TaxID=2480627 RepID=A0A4P5PAX4_9ENTE|nr:SDR family oxidoreductase [Enterococcus florum]GCF95130.1 epimerase [Enterococcus florum]